MPEIKRVIKIRKALKRTEEGAALRAATAAGEPHAQTELDARAYAEWWEKLRAENRAILSPPPPPSAFILEMCVPMAVTQDFIANLTEIYERYWVPKYGQKRAKMLWHRQCVGLIARHWFDVLVTAAERLRKVIYSWG